MADKTGKDGDKKPNTGLRLVSSNEPNTAPANPKASANKVKKNYSRNRKPKQKEVTVTLLEMTAPPLRYPPMPSRPKLALLDVKAIPMAFYHYLYDQVGAPHDWTYRKLTDQEKLRETLHSPDTHITVLYGDGAPAGYFELDTSQVGIVALAYFGLTPDFIGKGLGRWFLGAALHAAWSHKPEKVTVETNNLDHPRALSNYQRGGFTPVGHRQEKIDLID